MKKVRFEDNITVYKIPYEDRRNYEFIDKQKFKKRMKEFDKIFKTIAVDSNLPKA